MKRQSILVWIVVMMAGTSVYSADWQVDWVGGENIPVSWNWDIYPSHFPPSPHLPGTVPFSGPTGVFSNDCYAEANLGGTPTITIDSYQKTIELWFQPPAPTTCPALWNPVCGLNGWFGPLIGGDWLFYSNQIPYPYGGFCINFHVDGPLPTPTILNPNGDEYLLVGSTYTIRWEDSRSEGYCGGNYLLDYSIDDGNNWIPVASNTISNACSYDWLVPSIDANQCLIRITDADDPNITDTSDRPFYFYHEPTILHPNGNEHLLGGSTCTIRWWDPGSENCGGNYLLDYSIDNGNNWVPADSNTISNTCAHDWLVPSIFSNQCLIRITDANDPNISDTSDDSFRIYRCMSDVLGDWNGDCYVDFGDFSIIAAGWYVQGGTDMNDLASFVQYWLDCANPHDPYCRNFGEAMPDFPADGATIDDRTPALEWIPGVHADYHELYFSENFDDVNNRNPMVKEITIDPCRPYPPTIPPLQLGTTYYWLVDEVKSFPPERWNARTVWSFTTISGSAEPNFPADGAVIAGENYPLDPPPTHIWTELIFIPSATAVEHKGYFSEDYSKVASRHPDANLGSPPYASIPGWEYVFFAGHPAVPPAVDSLVRGTKYYWTVDSNDALGNTFYGDIWEFAVQGYKAFEPSPPNEAADVETDVLLSWLRGFYACYHDVYIGTSWEDVNNAAYDSNNPPPEFLARISEPNIAVTGLELNTKYYWRVDGLSGRSCCGCDPSFPFFYCYVVAKGDVWCFTTTPSALNNDGFINLQDYAIPSNYRQKTGPNPAGYIHKDDVVDYIN